MTYAPYVFLIVVCQLTHIETHRATGSPEDVVFRDIGAKIEKLGKSVSSENEIMISVIIKFPNISRIGDVEAAFSNPVVHRLHQKCSTSKFYQTVWETNNKYYRIRSEAFLSPDTESLMSYLDSHNVTNVFKNVCDKYNKSLEDLINPVFERLFVEKKQHSIDWVTLTILLVLVVAILVWLGYLQFWIKKLQTPQQVGARQSGSQVELVKLGSPRCASF